MAVEVTVSIKLVKFGEYEYKTQTGPFLHGPIAADPKPEPGRLVRQTSSVLAPGLARRLPV